MPTQLQNLNSLYMKINYDQFCQIINEGRQDAWIEEKWDAWIKFNHACNKLGSILNQLSKV